MAKKIRAKLVMELLGKNVSVREISRSRHIAPQSVQKVRRAAEEKGVCWDDVASMNDEDVCRLLFPQRAESEASFAKPDYDYVHKELQRSGVTLKLLYEEHCDQADSEGLVAKSYTTFARGYAEFARTRNVTNHLEHKPGQVMQVDWNGTTMRLVNDVTGEISKAYLFTATLPYSGYTYVEATLDMKQNAWLSCHMNAWEFFGGVAVRTVCDNLKTGVVKHPRHGEVVLNEAYEALGRHYVTAIMPTGVRKPKQKASVEGACGDTATHIVARLRDGHFAAIEELNAAIRAKLDEFNAAPFQKREGSRKEIFEEVESAFLAPLPKVAFELCEWVYGRKVNLNFHVVYRKNNYSVPHRYVGKSVDLKVTETTVEAYLEGSRIATHAKLPSYVSYRYQTDPSHMPPEFCKSQWDDKRIIKWAKAIGPSTHDVVARIFADVQIKEQAYNPALALLNLTKAYSEQELEAACAYALEKTSHPRCRLVKSILANKTFGRERKEDAEEARGYIRGVDYYKTGKE